MTQTHGFIKILRTLGQKDYEVKKVYRRMCDRELFVIAYGNLAQNQGRLTPGPDGETIDGMSMEKIDKIIEALKANEFSWQPVTRTYIPKANGKTRPLGLPRWTDKLVQEVMRMILEAYYEPQFLDVSHGFRPNRGCHTALQFIERWVATQWFIEMDIKGCFDNIPHDKILEILGRRFKDTKFLKLVKLVLKAGYLEKGKLNATFSGTPQGGVLSPILANIVLNELDREVTENLIPDYTRGKLREVNDEYWSAYNKARYRQKRGRGKEAKEYYRLAKTFKTRDVSDEDYRRLRYVRYADDALLGLQGSYEDAVEIKERLSNWLLDNTGLEVSQEKTLVTNPRTSSARFLGYEVSIFETDTQRNYKHGSGKVIRARTVTEKPNYRIPTDVIDKWVRAYLEKDKPKVMNHLLLYTDFEITLTYGAKWRGLVNYYISAHNISALRHVEWQMMRSWQATLARKHKSTTTEIRDKYTAHENGKKCFVCEVVNPKTGNTHRAILGGVPLRRNPFQPAKDYIPEIYLGRTELERRLLAQVCEICGGTEDIQVHHIKSIKTLKEANRDKQEIPKWKATMIARNRNTLVVCRKCHWDIHGGKFDGKTK